MDHRETELYRNMTKQFAEETPVPDDVREAYAKIHSYSELYTQQLGLLDQALLLFVVHELRERDARIAHLESELGISQPEETGELVEA